MLGYLFWGVVYLCIRNVATHILIPNLQSCLHFGYFKIQECFVVQIPFFKGRLCHPEKWTNGPTWQDKIPLRFLTLLRCATWTCACLLRSKSHWVNRGLHSLPWFFSITLNSAPHPQGVGGGTSTCFWFECCMFSCRVELMELLIPEAWLSRCIEFLLSALHPPPLPFKHRQDGASHHMWSCHLRCISYR